MELAVIRRYPIDRRAENPTMMPTAQMLRNDQFCFNRGFPAFDGKLVSADDIVVVQKSYNNLTKTAPNSNAGDLHNRYQLVGICHL
jgi:hypothetical protein